MFTGIVETIGTVAAVEGDRSGARLTITAPDVADGLAVGASIAVNGTCLTVVEATGDGFAVDVVVETLDRTNLGDLDVGGRVNLERAMRADGRFDGHIVQGHVDGAGEVVSLAPEGNGRRLVVRVPDHLTPYLVEKGSVTVDGTSLTVAAVEGDRIEIALIPHTLEVTTLGGLVPGARVNLEADVLAKYVERLVGGRA